MFTGIIETIGRIEKIQTDADNIHYTISSDLSAGFKIDQSIAHNGVCLTVVGLKDNTHTVTAIRETLDRTDLKDWQVGDFVNLERAARSDARLDGHIVQGHVDGVGKVLSIQNADGSWYYRIGFDPKNAHLLVDKGSVCVNGVSLTVVLPDANSFAVAIIPYTYEHTTFQHLQQNDLVNLEFDIIGKYIARYAGLYLNNK